MFFLLPLGVQGGTVRLPWAGATILLATVAAFIWTWVVHPPELAPGAGGVGATVSYWSQHPYLDYPDSFRRRFLAHDVLDDVKDTRLVWNSTHQPVAQGEVADQQRELNRLATEAVLNAQTPAFRSYSLDRTKGVVQSGWVTHLFLHAGWLHLIGNMLFLYAVALVLENAWGSLMFAFFYLLGGAVAGAAEVFLDPAPMVYLVGASGAVSACIGAATVRFATLKMKVSYLVFLGFFFKTGSFAIPVWLWGGFRLASEVYSFATDSAGGVAVLAHLGGFAFGALFAGLMWVTGFEHRRAGTWANEDAVSRLTVQGRAALEKKQVRTARTSFEGVLALLPDDVPAQQGLMEVELAERRPDLALKRLDRLVTEAQKSTDPNQLLRVAEHAAAVFPVANLSQGTAWTLGRVLAERGQHTEVVLSMLLRAGRPASGGSGRALLAASEVALALGRRDEARALLSELGSAALPSSMTGRLAALRRALEHPA